MSGGYPATDIDAVNTAMLLTSITGGASIGTENFLPLICNPNGAATKSVVMWGKKGTGALRSSEFKLKLPKILYFNAVSGSIFVASFNS